MTGKKKSDVPDFPGRSTMRTRPRTDRAKALKQRRCPKCHALLHPQRKRCKRCSEQLG